MTWLDQPDSLRRKRIEINPLYAFAEYRFLVERADICIKLNMSPEYFDNMEHIEHQAWIEAWNKENKEK